jgi:transposase-like protein
MSSRSKRELRQSRYFSEEFKLKKVKEIESGLTKVCEVCREYEVSGVSVYNWLNKYSRNMKSKPRMIVEAGSDTQKIQLLKQKLAEAERLLGQKQIEVEFLNKVIEIAEDRFNIEIKKKSGGKQ